MHIHPHFIGGNIAVEKLEDHVVYVERELRDTEGDWFYWAFCVEDAAGMTLTFRFPSSCRVGRFGPAVSHDLENWHWLDRPCTGDSFTYTFGPEEKRVYFAHNMLYPMDRFRRFCDVHQLKMETICRSVRGRDLPAVRFGSGDTWILLTARHHACESTGSYVLEGVLETLCSSLPAGYAVLAVPYVDYDGVLDGDQGKNRNPHDHNRDYIDQPIYASVDYIMQFGRTHTVAYTMDLHSPWHQGAQNDHVFLYLGNPDLLPRARRFSAFFREESAALPMVYDGTCDHEPSPDWKNIMTHACQNHFGRLPASRLSMTLETPYFGLEESKVSQDGLVALGNAFGRALLRCLET